MYKNQGSEAGLEVGFFGTAADGYSTADVTHIFLPAAGSRYESKLGYAGSDGCYWSVSLYADDPYCAHNLYFQELGVNAQDNVDRYYGQSVRAVRRK